MASLAEMEHELNVERSRAGLEIARQLGGKGLARAMNALRAYGQTVDDALLQYLSLLG